MKLPQDFEGNLVRDYSLRTKTTWKVGGKAELYAEPANLQDLLRLLEIVSKLNIPLFVLGRGSNLLVDDMGVPGITLSLGGAFQFIEKKEDYLRVGASTPMPTLANATCKLGYTGFEHLIGIPGTVGAGIVINAGKGSGNDMDMRRLLKSVTYLTRDLDIKTINVNDLNLSYRSSQLKNTPNIVLEATFILENEAPRNLIERRQKEILEERRLKFPLQLPNSGSVFKKPEGSYSAGKLIELAGLKGYRVGDAQVSEKHANFIVNLGSATSQDIKNLLELIVEKVLVVHGIKLEREVIFWPEQMNWGKE